MRLRKIVSSVLMSGAILASMAVPAMAADITMNGQGDHYKAYQLLTLTTALKSNCEHAGETGEVQHGKDCYTYRYEVNDKYRAALQGAADASWDIDGTAGFSDDELIEGISGMSAAETREFANKLYKDSVKDMEQDAVDTGKVFSGVDQGWYLIAESDTLSGSLDSYSLVMLDTAGQDDITVNAKEGVPTLTKKIKIADATAEGGFKYVDVEDIAYGDTVTFELTIGMPENIKDRDYKFIVHDNVQGLKLNNDLAVTVNGTAYTPSETNLKAESTEHNGCVSLVSLDTSDEILSNLITDKDSKIIVTYTGTLNTDFVTKSTGNTNEAHLEFTNDPYNDTSRAYTEPDTVTALTYKVIINKKDDTNAALKGARFTLHKQEGSSWTALSDANVIPTVDANTTTFTFKGLDAGTYKIEESTVPDGYNKADDIVFTIVATYDETSDNPQLASLKVVDAEGNEDSNFSVTLAEGEVSTDVINTTGLKLPSTGGMGVTYLYIGGAVLLVGGGAALVVLNKKKKTNESGDTK